MDVLPTLVAGRLQLRQLTHDDVDDVFALFGDPKVTAFMGIETRRDVDHARALIDDIIRLTREDTLYQWGIDVDGRVVGTVTLAQLDRRNQRAEVGFAVATAMQGRGLATEAVRRALQFAFGEMGLHRMEADVDPANKASAAVLEKVGFAREGYMPQRWKTADGWADTVFYGLLASAFETSV